MKFNLGQWFLLPGVEAIYPVSITDVSTEDGALTIQGYDHHIHTRSSFIHGSIITARFSSPMPGVIRVQMAHHKGRRERTPAFDLDYASQNVSATTGCDEHNVWLDAGGSFSA